jgi:tRNA(Ile)-lysidine synthase
VTTNPCRSIEKSIIAGLSDHVRAGEAMCIGLSGGLDSMVLLDIAHAAAAALGIRISAIHVHHGLSPNADDWAHFCEGQCAQRSIPLEIARVHVSRAGGLGLEAAARELRHACYAKVDAQWIALAHHADDFAETFLLRLLRGAGMKGLAAMPEVRPLGAGKCLIRPLLALRRSDLESYARERALAWIEDESNVDTGFDRNYLRHEVIPRLTKRFPAAVQNIQRAGDHARAAQMLLDDLARLDLQAADVDDALPMALMRSLSVERARNALRYHLAANGVAMPDRAHLGEAVRQIRECSEDARLLIELDGWQLRRQSDHIVITPPMLEDGRIVFECLWQGAREIHIAELGGTLFFDPAAGQGIRSRLSHEPGWIIRTRRGGEHMRPEADRPTRTLKNLFQERGVAAWERDRLPLLFHHDRLIWVPGIGIDCAYQCAREDDGIMPRWAVVSRV